MKNVKVRKAELLETLQENRERHIADFDIAWEAFREKAEENVRRMLDKLRNAPHGGPVELYIGLQPPENHVDDYDRAIDMLAWEVEDEVELNEGEFRNLVQDKWGWSDQFTMSNVQYTGSASPSSVNV